MAKETTKKQKTTSLCEEYVVERLKALEQINRELEIRLQVVTTEYRTLTDSVRTAFSKARIENSSSHYTEVFIHDSFVGLYNPNKVETHEQDLVALKELIKKTSITLEPLK